MAKDSKSIFFCQECGYESSKWMGQCPACHAWNSFAEEVVSKKTAKGTAGGGRQGTKHLQARSLSQITLDETSRITTGIAELDRVLGGGIVQSSLILIGGDPGIGKSTLLLQVCRNLAGQNR